MKTVAAGLNPDMELSANKSMRRPVSEQERQSAEYKPYLVSGASARLLIFPGGRLLSQSLEGPGFRIWFHDFFIKEAVALFALTGQRLNTLHYALRGHLSGAAAGMGVLNLEEGRYYLFEIPPGFDFSFFPEAGISRVFQIDFSGTPDDNFLEKEGLAHLLFPAISRGRNKRRSGVFIDYREQSLIRELREKSFTLPTVRKLFLKSRVYSLLELYAERAIHTDSERLERDEEKQKMAAVSAYINSHLDHTLTVAHLARRFYIGKSTLRKQFEACFRLTVGAYILNQRMACALFLLKNQHKSVRETAIRTGYEDVSAFRKAFKAHFHHAPSWYRRDGI